MSKRIKQDYEEQKRQAAENNAINQLETFHAESMTMEAHKSKDVDFEIEIRTLRFSLREFFRKINYVHIIQKLGYDQVKIIICIYN